MYGVPSVSSCVLTMESGREKEYALSGDDEPCHRSTSPDAEVYELPG